MRDEQHGLARGEPQRFEVEAHLLARQRVERAERLVHQQQRRVVDQRARDRHALAHAARQLVRIAVGEIREADLREQPQRALAVGARVEAAQLDLHQHVVERGAPVEQHRALEHDAEVRSAAGRRCGRRRAPRRRSARCSPATIRSSVLLPQPDGPTIARNSPSRIARSMRSSACVLAAARAGRSCATPASSTYGRGHSRRRRVAAAHRRRRAIVRRSRSVIYCGRNSLVWNVVQALSVCSSR